MMDKGGQIAKEPSCSKMRSLLFLVTVIMFGLLAVEAVNTVCLWTSENRPKAFPHRYVSKGTWSFFSLIRPLDNDSTDLAPTIHAVTGALQDDKELYDEFTLEGTSFIYPPAAVAELVGLGLISKHISAKAAFNITDILGRICTFSTIVIALVFLKPMLKSKIHWLIAFVIMLAFFPLRWGLMCVNVQMFITLYIVLVVLLYAKGYNVWAGILLGLAACLKPYFAAVLLFGVCRKQWKFVAGAVATGGVLILASLFIVGLSQWEVYFQDVISKVSSGYGYYPNHSINGIVHRWLGHPTSMVVAPGTPIVLLLTRITAIVFLIMSALPRGLRKNIPIDNECHDPSKEYLFRAMDISIAILAVIMASPIIWDHYYAWCIVMFAICARIYRVTDLGTGYLLLTAGAYVLLGAYVVKFPSITSGPMTLLHGTHFYGAVLLLIAGWIAQNKLNRIRCS